MIPAFTSSGFLPRGIHAASWIEFKTRFGFNQHRLDLLSGLYLVTNMLKDAGCLLIYIDGSFVTNKEYPDDYDACWDIYGVDPNKLDRLMVQFDDVSRSLFKMKYFGDVFPAQIPEGFSGKAFVDFFQTDKSSGEAKGIVALKPRAL
jgi:hypothetical protein